MVKKVKGSNYYGFSVIGSDSAYLYGFADTRGRNELYRIVKGETNPATSGNGGNAVLVATFVAQDDLIITVRALDESNMNVVVWSDSSEGSGTGDGDIWHIDTGGSMPATPTIAAAFPDIGLKSLGQDAIEYGSIGSFGNRSLMVTYQTNETAANQLLYMSDTSTGEDMSVIATFPTSLIRHLHCVNLAPDGSVWISAGDNDAQSAIIIWRPSVASTWPTITTWELLDAEDGFQVFSQATELSITDKRFRTTNFTFKGSHVYYMIDEYLTSQNTARGIWRMPFSSPALPERVSDHVVNVGGAGARWGWMGQNINGKLIFTDYIQSLEALTGNYNCFLYSSETGEAGSWEVLGSIMGTANGAPDPSVAFSMGLRAMMAIDGELHWSGLNMAGKQTTFNTEVFAVSVEDLIIEEDSPFKYDRLSPAYYVDPINGSDSSAGWSPSSAKETLSDMCITHKVTFGSAIMLMGDADLEIRTRLQWGSMVPARAAVNDNGPAVQVSKVDGVNLNWNQDSGVNSTIFNDTSDHSIILDGIELRNSNLLPTYTTSGALTNVYFEMRNALSDSDATSTRILRPGSGTGFYAFRSKLLAFIGGGVTTAALQTGGGGGGTTVVKSCEVQGGSKGIEVQGGSNILKITNNVFFDYGFEGGLDLEGASNTIEEFSNNVFADDSGVAITDSGSNDWSASEKNWFAGSVPSFISGVNGEFLTDVPGFVSAAEGDYHLTEVSELRNAGDDYDANNHFDLDSVIFSTPLSIGAFEFISIRSLTTPLTSSLTSSLTSNLTG